MIASPSQLRPGHWLASDARGSSAVKPFMAQLRQALAAQATPISLIYTSPGSCSGQKSFFVDGYVTGTGLTVYNAAGASGLTCDI